MRNHLFDFWGVRTVANCGYNTCVANVAALIKNREEGSDDWTAEEIQHDHGRLIIDHKSRVSDIQKALRYIERAADRQASKNAVRFVDARAIGDYAIFMNYHVLYGIIEAGHVVSILDGNVGRGWESWQSFVEYALTLSRLYGPPRYVPDPERPDPARPIAEFNDQAYLLKPLPQSA